MDKFYKMNLCTCSQKLTPTFEEFKLFFDSNEEYFIENQDIFESMLDVEVTLYAFSEEYFDLVKRKIYYAISRGIDFTKLKYISIADTISYFHTKHTFSVVKWIYDDLKLNPNTPTKHGNYPLLASITTYYNTTRDKNRYVEMIIYLLDKGANIDEKSEYIANKLFIKKGDPTIKNILDMYTLEIKEPSEEY